MLDQEQTGITCIAAPPQDDHGIAWHIAGYAFGFAVLWLAFYGIFILFPFISTGADVVYRAKLKQEFHGTVFPENHSSQRILIFGTSKILAGFIPDEFDRLAAVDHLNYYSYNSGYPARQTFVPELRKMVKRKSGVPDIVLLTIPWENTTNRINIFRLPWSDHDIAEDFFPFRYLVRDFFSFLITSRQHGGPLNYYREGGANVAKMLKDRGYYFVSEQSHYPNDRLPDDFHLPSDDPSLVMTRSPDARSAQLSELNQIIDEHHIRCYFVPQYEREGEYASPPKMDRAFAGLLRLHSSCKLLGPDYFLYPNQMFSDRAHLNHAGAQVYTRAIYDLLSEEESRGH
ncbi:MAG TPA: hypothetical protein VK638_54135 [Edaphobacter sp.]|nr:hypothetical protein [Edaphobacter sp.]